MKILVLLISMFGFSSEIKILSEGMFGDKMAVEHYKLNSGKHILKVKESTGVTNKKAQFKEIKTIEVDVKSDESLSAEGPYKWRLVSIVDPLHRMPSLISNSN